MSMKKLFAILLTLVMVVSLMMAGCAPANQPENPQGESTEGTAGEAGTFTVEVTHKDGSVKTFTYPVSDKNLGAILVEQGLAVESSSPGMYTTVDGETADWNTDKGYWCFYIGDEMAMKGMNDTPVHAGDVFKLVYTIG